MDIIFVPPRPNARKSGAIIVSFIVSIGGFLSALECYLTGVYLKVANESIAENFCGGCERDHFCVIDLLLRSLLRFGSFYENGKVVEG
jgi:hypothetical protein